MAKFYGKSSRYLIKGDLKNYGYALGLVLLVLIIFSLIFKYFILAVPLAGLFLIFVLVQLADPFIMHFRRKSDRFYQGFSGEGDIKDELKNLSDDFSVYQDVQLGDNKGNLDFVVVGPPGVFILEVKSHKGEVGFNGQNVTVNGREYGFLRQVHGQTWALKNYLKQTAGAEVYIYPALVFSSRYAGMRFGFTPMGNVYIIQKGFLPELFSRFKRADYPRLEIERALLKTVKN